MELRLADDLLKELSELGQAIDIGRPTYVYDGGQVGLTENKTRKENEDEREGTGGPAAGSRQGPEGARRPSGEAGNSVGRIWPEWLIADGLPLLLESYPGGRVDLDPHGCWTRVQLLPLGGKGPEAILLIAWPESRTVHPRCWAFWREPFGMRSVGPRHTNYPWSDACAFPQFAGYWSRSDGICNYVDIHAEWLIRQLYRSVFGRWSGRQTSPFALYALNQFGPNEHCHCQSGRKYADCCHQIDLAEYYTDVVRQSGIALKFTQGLWFNNQKPPRDVLGYALGGDPPTLATTFLWFQELADFRKRAKALRYRLDATTATTPVRLRTTLQSLAV